MATVVNELFTEKFRPKTIEALIAPDRIKSELKRGLIQNLLLYGSPGTGKTSTLFILAKDHTYKYINASSERGIDTIREDIAQFCSGVSLLGGKEQLKCVILDEFDNATDSFYLALRAVMERYSKVARFVASCNFLPKIPEPLQSRFHLISYDPINSKEEDYLVNEYAKRISLIMNKIGIAHTEETMDRFVRAEFPDMRSLMNKLQSLYNRGVKELNEETITTNYDFVDLFQVCASRPDKPQENYKFVVSNYANKIDDALISLGKDFPDYIRNKYPEKSTKLPMIIIAMADYQYQKALTIDPMVTLLAAVYKIQTILHS